jgi:hypothetical protein
MALIRPKHPVVYTAVSDWWRNTGGVRYIAHVVTQTQVIAFGPENTGTSGGSPSNHPDQQFWQQNRAGAAFTAANKVRVEIDCSLMPCNTADTSCLYKVPQFLTQLGLTNVVMLVFSHRDENVGDAKMEKGGMRDNKRVFRCNSADTDKTALQAAYSSHEPWTWSSYTDHQQYRDII